MQHLDGDVAVVPEVVGEVDGRHAASAELALDAVAIRECCREPFHAPAHRCTVAFSSAAQFRITRSSGAAAGSGSNIRKCSPSGITSKLRSPYRSSGNELRNSWRGVPISSLGVVRMVTAIMLEPLR